MPPKPRPGPPVDVSKLNDADRAFYEKYGRLPPKKKDLLLKNDRKFFDSGDYALSQAGKASPKDVGSAHPVPDRIPHSVPTHMQVAQPGHAASPVPGAQAGAKVKESGLAHEQKVEDVGMEERA